MRMSDPGARRRSVSRTLLLLPIIVLFITESAFAGTVQSQLFSLGANWYRYDFVLGGMKLDSNQAFEVRFDPEIYLALGNGIATSDFTVTLLEPNNPPGTFGDYTAVARVDGASLTGPFGVDVQFAGVVQLDSLSYVVNQLDQDGKFVSTIDSGFTTSAAIVVPEPASSLLSVAGVLMWGLYLVCRRFSEAR